MKANVIRFVIPISGTMLIDAHVDGIHLVMTNVNSGDRVFTCLVVLLFAGLSPASQSQHRHSSY